MRRAVAADVPPLPHVRLADTDRLEAFSDGVFAITITLLVAEIVRPDHEAGHLLDKLVSQWPNYIAFLASFCYVGVIWLNHRAVFSRVRYCDRALHIANLFLLLTSGLIPFPTALLSFALQHGNPFDAQVAVAVYALIGGLMCLAWLLLFHVLTIHPYLLEKGYRPGVLSPGTAARLGRGGALWRCRRDRVDLGAAACPGHLSSAARLLWHYERGANRDAPQPLAQRKALDGP